MYPLPSGCTLLLIFSLFLVLFLPLALLQCTSRESDTVVGLCGADRPFGGQVRTPLIGAHCRDILILDKFWSCFVGLGAYSVFCAHIGLCDALDDTEEREVCWSNTK